MMTALLLDNSIRQKRQQPSLTITCEYLSGKLSVQYLSGIATQGKNQRRMLSPRTRRLPNFCRCLATTILVPTVIGSEQSRHIRTDDDSVRDQQTLSPLPSTFREKPRVSQSLQSLLCDSKCLVCQRTSRSTGHNDPKVKTTNSELLSIIEG